jgi:hypothetical protein
MELLVFITEQIVILLVVFLYVYSVEYIGIYYFIRSRRYRNSLLRLSHVVTLYCLLYLLWNKLT